MLKQPVTGKRILEAARQVAPSMSYQDLRHILRNFQEEGIITCLNPECQTGRFYVRVNYVGTISQTSNEMELCAKVGRAKTRLAVLKEVAKDRFFESHPLTATQIKKYMRETYPLGLNHVSAALKFLEKHQLVEISGYTNKRDLKIFRITNRGKTILTHMTQNNSSSVCTPTRIPCNGTEEKLPQIIPENRKV